MRGERHRRWLREGDPSVARRLAQIGVLGWIIVTPMLIGIFVGRWLDRTFNSGLFCTAPLLMLGLGARLLVRLEMDEKRMTVLSFNLLPPWMMAISVGAHLLAGFALGLLYFRGLWWNAQQLAVGGHLITTTALWFGRFAVLAGLLALTSSEGALPLLATALGVLIARPLVMRRVREATL